MKKSETAIDKEEPTPTKRTEHMGGLAKGLAILESFSPRQPKLTITEAAQLSGTTPAAARRCLLTLQDLGYLTSDGKFYSPTPRFTRLASGYLDTTPLGTLGRPVLEQVRDELDEPASLVVLE